MPSDENATPLTGRRQREPETALQLGPRKKPYVVKFELFIHISWLEATSSQMHG